MDIDNLLERLVPLFEKKVAWQMEKENRDLTFREKLEERKVDLDYRKLESQIKNDNDKIALEREKTYVMAQNNIDVEIARQTGAYNVQLAANQGWIAKENTSGKWAYDTERLKQSAETKTHTVSANGDVSDSTTVNKRAQDEYDAAHPGIVSASPASGEDALFKVMGSLMAKNTPESIEQARQIRSGLPADVKSRFDTYLNNRVSNSVSPITAPPVQPTAAPSQTAPAVVSPAAAPISEPDLNNVSAPSPVTIGTPRIISPQESLDRNQKAWERSHLTAFGAPTPFRIMNSPVEAAKMREYDAQSRISMQPSVQPSAPSGITPPSARIPMTPLDTALTAAEAERKRKEEENKNNALRI